MLRKLTYAPDQSSYSDTPANETLTVNLQGGASRYRKDVLSSTSVVSARWTLSLVGYTYLKKFYNSVSKKASVPFLIDLIIDDGDLTEHTVHFVPGSFRLVSVKGHSRTITAQLEVEPVETDEATDLAYLDMVDAYGEKFGDIFNPLETIGNFRFCDVGSFNWTPEQVMFLQTYGEDENQVVSDLKVIGNDRFVNA